ncbi:hypothetical protein [Wolbachia endosymbiont (group A) of Ennomos erosarius]|uniref:hypothetical protein n=1 Tax=Wolbachia endosymbiont (group A) of Ennomos erosarius TaxID=3066174 RepID=UPI00333F1FB4
MFISRYNGSQNRKWNAPPIVVELKKGRETAKDAIRQIETQGYIKNLPSMRTTAEQGIEVGVNFDLDPNGDGISVKESAKITKPKGFVELFNKFNELSEEDLKAELKTKLNHLYFSIVESNGGGENTNYLSRLILGELFADNTLEKHIFIHTEDHAKYGYGKHNTKSGRAPQDVITPKHKMISTFMFEMQDNQYVILNIIEGKDFRGKKSIPLRLKSINPNKYMQVNIKVNPEARGGFKVEDNPEEFYYQDIEIGKVAGSGKKYEGEFKKIEHVKLLAMPDEAQTKNLQKALSPRLLDMPDEVQTENLQKALSPLKKLIMAESDFQAVMQGLFIAQAFDEKGKIIRVFTEPNYSSVGKPDLVVSCIEKVGGIYKELELIFMELKFLEGGNVREIFVQARRQLLRYKSNIKTFTDLEEVSGMVMIFSINKKSEEVLIIDKLNTNGQEVDGSQGEDLELQKQKMKIRVDHSSIDPDSQRTPIQDGSPDAWSPGSRSDARSSQGSIGARHESPNQLDLPESPIPQSSLDRLPLEESVYMQPGPLCYQHGFSSPKPGPSGYQRVSSPNYVLDSPQASQQGSSQSKSPISQSSSDGSLRCFSQVPTNKNTPSEKRRGSSSDESEGSSPLKNYKTVRPYQRRA